MLPQSSRTSLRESRNSDEKLTLVRRSNKATFTQALIQTIRNFLSSNIDHWRNFHDRLKLRSLEKKCLTLTYICMICFENSFIFQKKFDENLTKSPFKVDKIPSFIFLSPKIFPTFFHFFASFFASWLSLCVCWDYFQNLLNFPSTISSSFIYWYFFYSSSTRHCERTTTGAFIALILPGVEGI